MSKATERNGGRDHFSLKPAGFDVPREVFEQSYDLFIQDEVYTRYSFVTPLDGRVEFWMHKEKIVPQEEVDTITWVGFFPALPQKSGKSIDVTIIRFSKMRTHENGVTVWEIYKWYCVSGHTIEVEEIGGKVISRKMGSFIIT